MMMQRKPTRQNAKIQTTYPIAGEEAPKQAINAPNANGSAATNIVVLGIHSNLWISAWAARRRSRVESTVRISSIPQPTVRETAIELSICVWKRARAQTPSTVAIAPAPARPDWRVAKGPVSAGVGARGFVGDHGRAARPPPARSTANS